MELGEIISDALVYPFHNIKALVIYLILGIILGLALGGTVVAIIAGATFDNMLAAFGTGIIGIIISLVLYFLISGYQVDIIKYGIDRSASAPSIDFVRQFFNGIKLFVTQIIYMIVPIIIAAILAIVFQSWLAQIIILIVAIIFGLALMMAQCRLAKTEELGSALAIGEAIGDISRVGLLKLILLIIVLVIIIAVLYFIVGLIMAWNTTVGGILMGILGVYVTFFCGRAIGLLYSDV